MSVQTLLAPPPSGAARPGTASTKVDTEVVGIGFAPAHHGELLQGMFLDDAGVPHRALVTLPQPALGTRAVFRPSYTHGGVLGPPELIKVRRAAILTLSQLPSYRSPAKGGQ